MTITRYHIIITLLMSTIKTVVVQFAFPPQMMPRMPMFPPLSPQMLMPMSEVVPIPAPQAVPIPAGLPVPMSPITLAETAEATNTTMSTTTTRPVSQEVNSNANVAFPVVMPWGVQIAVPAPTPPAFCTAKSGPPYCPPCPPCICSPSCTPSFYSYCSPCHLKCRCRDPKHAPIPLQPDPRTPVSRRAYPMPIGLYGPPSVVVPHPGRPIMSITEYDEDQEKSEEKLLRNGDKRNKKRRHHHNHRKPLKKLSRKRLNIGELTRRGFDVESDEDNEITAMLTYIDENGYVKLAKRISEDEAEHLLKNEVNIEKEKGYKTFQQGSEALGEVLLESDNEKNNFDNAQSSRRIITSNNGNTLDKSKNQLVFTPETDRLIRNISLSFRYD